MMKFRYVIGVGSGIVGIAGIIGGLIMAINVYTGKPAKLPEEPKKPAVSRALEERVETRHIPDEELISLYEKLLAKSIERKEILSRSYEEKRRLGRIVSEGLDTKSIVGSYFVKDKTPTAYYDPNLEIPHEAPNLLSNVIAMRNPKVHVTRSGKQAFYAGFGYWAESKDFDTKPSPHAIGLFKAEDYETALRKVRGFIGIINPSITPEDLEKLVNAQSADVRASVYKALRAANGNLENSPLDYSNLKRGEEALSEYIKVIKQF